MTWIPLLVLLCLAYHRIYQRKRLIAFARVLGLLVLGWPASLDFSFADTFPGTALRTNLFELNSPYCSLAYSLRERVPYKSSLFKGKAECFDCFFLNGVLPAGRTDKNVHSYLLSY